MGGVPAGLAARLAKAPDEASLQSPARSKESSGWDGGLNGDLAPSSLSSTRDQIAGSFSVSVGLHPMELDENSSFLGLVLQGSGPHFCPGGNVNAQIREGESAFTLAPFTGFIAELRLLQSMGPGNVSWVVCSLHGLVQGGGLAMSQICDFRVADSETSYVLGNLSRGAVPCILLSGRLPLSFPTLSEAMAFYLGDMILDMNGALSLNLIQEVLPSVSSAKEEAFRLASEMMPAAAARVHALRPLIDVNRFAQESYALQLSLKCGEAFQPKGPQLVKPKDETFGGPMQIPEKRRAKAKVRRPLKKEKKGVMDPAEKIDLNSALQAFLSSSFFLPPFNVIWQSLSFERSNFPKARLREPALKYQQSAHNKQWTKMFQDSRSLQRLHDLLVCPVNL